MKVGLTNDFRELLFRPFGHIDFSISTFVVIRTNIICRQKTDRTYYPCLIGFQDDVSPLGASAPVIAYTEQFPYEPYQEGKETDNEDKLKENKYEWSEGHPKVLHASLDQRLH